MTDIKIDLESLTDHELNLMVYKKCGAFSMALPDYCNDINVAWPILIHNHISIARTEEFGWEVCLCGESYYDKCEFDHECDASSNLIRSAMILYLEKL